MTNYNERLDELLEDLTADIADQFGGDTTEHPQPHLKKQAKQAIISLIKELVAEAKPGTWVDPEDTDDLEWQGYVSGVDDFEQSLLKALEEV